MSGVHNQALWKSPKLRARLNRLIKDKVDLKEMKWGELVPKNDDELKEIYKELFRIQSKEEYRNNQHWWIKIRAKETHEITEILDDIEAELSRQAAAWGSANPNA